MTIEELKDLHTACEYSKRMNFIDKQTQDEIIAYEEKLNIAINKLKLNMTRSQSLIMCDYIFSNSTIQEIADRSNYTTRSIDRMIDKANKIVKAL